MSALKLQHKLMLSTATLMGALTGYGRGAYAACIQTGAASYECSGMLNSSQLITLDNVAVTTVPNFSVTGAAPTGITIFSDGARSYTDENMSTLDASITALSITTVTSGGPGSITVNTNGTLTGGDSGIVANNQGAGAVSITANGDVTGTANNGISATNIGSGLSVTTGANATVYGGDNGILANHQGIGAVTVTANGNVTGNTQTGIQAQNTAFGSDVTVTTGTGYIHGSTAAIGAFGAGSGAVTVTANGNVTSDTNIGIVAQNSIAGSDMSVTTAAGTTVLGDFAGIRARNYGSGTLDIIVNGDVTGTRNDGIYARRTLGDEINILVNAGGAVTSNGTDAPDFAIDAIDGETNITLAGTLNGGAGGAIRFDQNDALDDRLELHTTGVVNGNVLAGPGDDTLAFAGTGNGSFDLADIDTGANTQQYRGFETFVVESATWTMNNTTTADFIVNGGTLKGNGTFGSLTVNNGTLAPGNSFGTMTVNGVFTLNAGATFEVEVNAANMGDLVVVNGTVNLTGATLSILAESGNYALETDYVIIDNDGNDAVNGTFGTITSSLAFLIATVSYTGGTGNDVVLTLTRNEVDPCDVANTGNQAGACGAIDPDNPLYPLILGQSAAGARQAFDALSGEVHATIAGVLVDDNRYVREAIMGRLMQASHTNSNGQVSALGAAGPRVASLDQNGLDQSAMALAPLAGDDKSLAPPASSPMAFWTAAYGAWGSYDGDGNAATADRDLGGFMSGMDASIGGSWRLGLTTGASFSNVSVDARNSSANAESYYLGAYTGGMVGAFALRGGGTWAWSEIDTSRAVIFPGFYERQKANYDADTSQLFGEAAYPTTMGGMSVEPFVGLAYVSIDTDRFLERGGALASLRGRNSDQTVGYSTLGLRVATTSQWGSMSVTPHLSARWQHAFDDVTPEAALAFATTGTGFNVSGVPLAEDSALIDAGLDFAIGENTSAGVSYSGQFGEGVTDNAVKGRFTWLF